MKQQASRFGSLWAGLGSRKMRSIAFYAAILILLTGILGFFTTSSAPRLQDFAPLDDIASDSNETPAKEHDYKPHEPAIDPDWTFNFKRDGRNYGLTEEQCNAAFPNLYKEIERAVQHRKDTLGGRITKDEVDVSWAADSMVRAMIYDNQLYVIVANKVNEVRERPRVLATLHALHRAITSYQGSLPNIEFSFSVHDWALKGPEQMNRTTWAYTRYRDQEKLWLMPDFGLWGWPDVGLRSYAEFQAYLSHEEDEFVDKIPKLVWRGSLGVGSKDVRTSLLEHSKGQPWSDVLELDWSDPKLMEERLLTMQDHCAYMFVAQTEGNSYSGRLKYLLNCHSIVFSHSLDWLEPYHHLMIPSGASQNFVLLKRDFSDLPEKMAKMSKPRDWAQAQKIADNSRRTFRERYLTPAAEACYWRAMIRAWAGLMTWTPEFWVESLEYDKVLKKEKTKRRPRGVPFEAFIIMEEVEWDIPAKGRELCIKED